jgi:hypothetical protein
MDVVAALTAQPGARVFSETQTLQQARTDKLGHESATSLLCAVIAESVADVQATIRIASAAPTPLSKLALAMATLTITSCSTASGLLQTQPPEQFRAWEETSQRTPEDFCAQNTASLAMPFLDCRLC